MSLKITGDTLTPGLARAATGIANRSPILEAMGLQLVATTKQAFRDPGLRPAAWPPRKTAGTNPLLRKSGAMWQSIRIAGLTQSTVTVASDRPYAAVHQFGSSKKTGRGGGIPARPFFPFTLDGRMTPVAQKKIEAIGRAKIASILRG